MKLEFEQKVIDDNLFKELDLNHFLSLFDYHIPFLPKKILRPMEEKEATDHFSLLLSLQEHNEMFEDLIEISRNIPFIEDLVTYYKNSCIEQYHLNQLGTFISTNLELDVLEKQFPLDKKLRKNLEKIKDVLEKYTKENFSAIVLSEHEKQLTKKIETLNQEIKKRIKIYEKEIYLNCKLKMTYPYPKEIAQTSKLVPAIKNYCDLSLKKQEGNYSIDYKLPADFKEMLEKLKTLKDNLSSSINSKLKSINDDLSPYFSKFNKYYELRKERIFYYCLLESIKRSSLVIPDFQQETGMELTNARLPVLERVKQGNYIPLTLKLRKGANVLFGANMAGKTTVLKTIFLQLIAIKFGLPVPAERIKLSFPTQVEFNLKNSLALDKTVSTFGNELLFFSKNIKPGSFILVDEMFHSTNPIGGMELSKIILKEFAEKDCVFLCNTHYLEILRMEDVNLYKMKDIDFSEELDSSDSKRYNLILNDLVNKMPYKIEQLTSKKVAEALVESKKPLFIALYFPLPKTLKKKISSYLNKEDEK